MEVIISLISLFVTIVCVGMALLYVQEALASNHSDKKCDSKEGLDRPKESARRIR